MKKFKKDITFIYSDSAEREIYKPIAEEAKRRGYSVRLTDDRYAKCEIGFYCQHINFPQYSKLSFIMLHDIIQQYGKWPDIWLREPWNKYDVGILPSSQWVRNWQQASQWYYANPRRGMFLIGWPKADNYVGLDRVQYRKEFNRKHGMDDAKPTILYAPAWENDNKQDDFVRAMQKLDVNILIKQGPFNPDFSPEYKATYDAIQEMYELHKDIPGVTILNMETNIFEAILASDVLVSEESSTMCEAAMMGIPAVAVSDWLIPDVTPHRLPECNYDFAIPTTRAALGDKIAEIISHYDDVLAASERFRRETFGEIGGCAEKIMDIVDDCVAGQQIRYEPLQGAARKPVPPANLVYHVTESVKRELYHNYNQRYPWFHAVYEPVRRLKKKLEGRL